MQVSCSETEPLSSQQSLWGSQSSVAAPERSENACVAEVRREETGVTCQALSSALGCPGPACCLCAADASAAAAFARLCVLVSWAESAALASFVLDRIAAVVQVLSSFLDYRGSPSSRRERIVWNDPRRQDETTFVVPH